MSWLALVRERVLVLKLVTAHLNKLRELVSLLMLDVHIGHVDRVRTQWVWQAVLRVNGSLEYRFNCSLGSHGAGVVEGRLLSSFSVLAVVGLLSVTIDDGLLKNGEIVQAANLSSNHASSSTKCDCDALKMEIWRVGKSFDASLTVVPGAKLESLLDKLPRAHQVTNTDCNGGLADVPELVDSGHWRLEIIDPEAD